MRTFLVLMIFTSTIQDGESGMNHTQARLDAIAAHRGRGNILNDLFRPDNYHLSFYSHLKGVGPENRSITAGVYMLYTATKIINLDERAEQLSVAVDFVVIWTDTRLQWDSEDYDGTRVIIVDLKKMAIPPIMFTNSVGEKRLLSKEDIASVHFTGMVRVEKSLILTAPCEMDITYFPVDTQVCEQEFKLFNPRLFVVPTTEDRKLGFRLYDDSIWFFNRSRDVYAHNPLMKTFTRHPASVKLLLYRKYQYYTYRILAPITILSTLVILSFFIPPDAGEKISFGITLLLTFSVFQTMIDADLPTSSNSTPLLTTAMIYLQMCAAMSIVAAILVLNIHHTGPEYWKMPRCLKFMLFTICAKFTFHTSYTSLFIDNESVQNNCTDEPLDPNPTFASSETVKKEETRQLVASEWKLAARIVDRMLMYVCLATQIGVCVSLLMRLYQANSDRFVQHVHSKDLAENRQLLPRMYALYFFKGYPDCLFMVRNCTYYSYDDLW